MKGERVKSKENGLAVDSKAFALRIVELYRLLSSEKKEFVMSRQLLRSGTSIGANIAEAQYAQSKADFLSKMTIALKEASETLYWLQLLNEAGFILREDFDSLERLSSSLIARLVSSVKTVKKGIKTRVA